MLRVVTHSGVTRRSARFFRRHSSSSATVATVGHLPDRFDTGSVRSRPLDTSTTVRAWGHLTSAWATGCVSGRSARRSAGPSPSRRTTTTYAQLQERIDRAATVLRDGGIRAGDRVGYLGFNHPAFLETMFATARLGAIFVPLNFRLTGPELEFIINDAGCHTMVADSKHTARARHHPRRRLGAAMARRREGERVRRVGRLRRFPRRGRRRSGETPAVDADAVAVIMYTSGTTGLPEGGDAHARQLLVEQRQRGQHARHPRRRRHARVRSALPHRWAQRHDAAHAAEGR